MVSCLLDLKQAIPPLFGFHALGAILLRHTVELVWRKQLRNGQSRVLKGRHGRSNVYKKVAGSSSGGATAVAAAAAAVARGQEEASSQSSSDNDEDGDGDGDRDGNGDGNGS